MAARDTSCFSHAKRYDRIVDKLAVSDSEQKTRANAGWFDDLFARPEDLTAYARIRDAALTLFAKHGVGATSIRDIAAAAGVSPGLVQHHFRTKNGIRDAINERVRLVVENAFTYLPGLTNPNSEEWMAGRFASLAEDHATALRYLARALADEDPHARSTFDALVAAASSHLSEQAAFDQVALMLGKALIQQVHPT